MIDIHVTTYFPPNNFRKVPFRLTPSHFGIGVYRNIYYRLFQTFARRLGRLSLSDEDSFCVCNQNNILFCAISSKTILSLAVIGYLQIVAFRWINVVVLLLDKSKGHPVQISIQMRFNFRIHM